MGLRKINIRSISSKLIISLVLLCLIPLLAVGFITYNQSRNILAKKLQVTSNQTLSEINRGMTNYFNGLKLLLNFISESKEFSQETFEASKVQDIEQMLSVAKKSNPDILNVFYGPENGGFIFYPRVELPKNFNHKDRAWYKAAIANKGSVVFTEPYKDEATGMVVVSLVKAVEVGGRVIGVAGMDINLTTLSSDTAKIKVGQGGYVFISDINGILLAHPKNNLIGTKEAAKLDVWNEVKSNKSGFTKYNYGGLNKFGAYETNELTGWKLFAILEELELIRDTNSIKGLVIIVSLIIGVIGVIISVLLSRGMAKNISILKDAFSSAAAGDLTIKAEVSSKDELRELGNYFSIMLSNISSLMKNVEQSSEIVLETSTNLASMAEETSASISEVSRAIEEVSQGAGVQAQNSQEGAAYVNDLSKELEGIFNTTTAMDSISENASSLTNKGLEMVQSLQEKSNKTKLAAMDISKVVLEMNENSFKVNTISDTISNITDQTNLLALNASIEAARAGEAGRGFTVVAEEIRKLAEQSRGSTEEIKKINDAITKKALTAVQAMEQTKGIIEEQEIAVNNTKHIFNEITEAIEQIVEKVFDIKASVTEVNNRKEKVVDQIENISSISQETASASQQVTASTEEITATMEEFTGYAEKLQSLSEKLALEINKFKL